MDTPASADMQTPILFLIFNRPEMASRTFERIREARPEKLFVAADGPRSLVPEDAGLCMETRRIVLDRIDWPCEIHTLLRNENLGCKIAISSAIDWFFEHVEEGVILEDDCLPDPTFFHFCAELLHRYRDDNRIMMISGNNFLPAQQSQSPQSSYFFSKGVLIWGWATWRRAWQHYDVSMPSWPEFRRSNQLSSFLSRRLAAFWQKTFDFHHSGKGTTWDVQWVFSCWKQSGYSILPECNMVENIGEVGVHMKPYDPCINLAALPARFPLQHPDRVGADPHVDRKLMNRIYRNAPATAGYILQFLARSAVSKERNFRNDLHMTVHCLIQEFRKRYLS